MNLSSFADEDLVREIILTQNNTLVGELYDRYANKIFRRTITFVKSQSLAEDLTHDIFLKILLNLSTFKEKSKFSTWIYSITYNFCIDYLRKRNKQRFQSFDLTYESSDLVEEVDDYEEIRTLRLSRLKVLLEKMHVDERMILLMKYKDGLSIKDIQKTFGLSESAVKMRLKRAREKVQKLYSSTYNGNEDI